MGALASPGAERRGAVRGGRRGLGGWGRACPGGRGPRGRSQQPLAASSSPGKAGRAAPPPTLWSVRGGQGRHSQGSGRGGGAAGRVGAGVLLSCIFSRLQRRNFFAGSGAGAAAPQQLPELRVGQENRDRPGKSLGHALGRGDSSLSFPVTLLQARPGMLS